MSYCRWSSDDFQCDVYVYASADGWETHLAGSRYVFAEPLPAPLHDELSDGWIKEHVARHAKVLEVVKRTPLEPINLPHDGESFTDDTAGECADRLMILRDLGYRVPQYAIDALREEEATA